VNNYKLLILSITHIDSAGETGNSVLIAGADKTLKREQQEGICLHRLPS
jgi:hypothetical protein